MTAIADPTRIEEIARKTTLTRKDQGYLHRLSLRIRARARTDGLHTTGQTAARLGVKSINTIKRWADDGLLEAKRQPGGHMKITEASIQRLEARFAEAAQRKASKDFTPAIGKRAASPHRRAF